MNNPPRNEEIVQMMRDVAKLHGVTYTELAALSGVPLGTLGGVMSGFQRLTQDRFERVWKALFTCAERNMKLLRQECKGAKLHEASARQEIQRIKQSLRKLEL